jgi:hypothetical protein
MTKRHDRNPLFLDLLVRIILYHKLRRMALFGKGLIPKMFNTEKYIDLIVFSIISKPYNVLGMFLTSEITFEVNTINDLFLSTVLKVEAELVGEDLVVG